MPNTQPRQNADHRAGQGNAEKQAQHRQQAEKPDRSLCCVSVFYICEETGHELPLRAGAAIFHLNRMGSI